MHTISKGLLERLFSDGYSNNELTEKTLLSVLLKNYYQFISKIIKLLPVSVGYLTRVLQLEHQTLLDWHDISLQHIHDFLTKCKYKVDPQ